jgi:hypothetical protein
MMNDGWMNDCCLHFILHKMYALHKTPARETSVVKYSFTTCVRPAP